jgi:transposase InsO family protein
MVSVDVVGPLIQSKRGNKYIFTAVDLYTKNAEILPVTNTTTLSFVDFVKDRIIANHGVPKTILVDNAQYFTATLVKELLGKYGIKIVASSPYNPEGNGATERFNKTLSNMIKVNSTGDGLDREWDSNLTDLLLAYRMTPHRSTGYSPFMMEHGRNPLKYAYEIALDGKPKTEDQYLRSMKEILKIIHGDAERKLEQGKVERNKVYLKKNKLEEFKKGDKVWIHIPQRQGFRKLYHAWKGPYKIVRKWSRRVYSVENTDLGIVYNKVNIRRIRRCNSENNQEENKIKWFAKNDNSKSKNIINNNTNWNWTGMQNNNDDIDEKTEEDNESVGLGLENLFDEEKEENENEENEEMRNNTGNEFQLWRDGAVASLQRKKKLKTRIGNLRQYCNDTLKSWETGKNIIEGIQNETSNENQVTKLKEWVNQPERKKKITDNLKK